MKRFGKYFSLSVKAFGVLIITVAVISIFFPKPPANFTDTDAINANSDILEKNITIRNYIPESYNEWKNVSRLKTGDYPFESTIPNKFFSRAVCELKIINDSRLDAVIFLHELKTDSNIRHAFIRQGSKFTFFRLPEGKYFVKVYIGYDWDTNKYILGGIFKGGFKFSEALVTFKDEDDDVIEMLQSSDGKYLSGSRYDFRIYHKSLMDKIERKGTGL